MKNIILAAKASGLASSYTYHMKQHSVLKIFTLTPMVKIIKNVKSLHHTLQQCPSLNDSWAYTQISIVCSAVCVDISYNSTPFLSKHCVTGYLQRWNNYTYGNVLTTLNQIPSPLQHTSTHVHTPAYRKSSKLHGIGHV